MADPADKASVFQPFSDIVGGQRDEGYVNLSRDLGKKVAIPSDSVNGSVLVFNPSTGRYEAAQITSNSILDGTITATDIAAGAISLNNYTGVCSSDLTLSTTATDITGAAVTLAAATTYVIYAGFYWSTGVAGFGFLSGTVVVDGSTLPKISLFDVASANVSTGSLQIVTTSGTNKVAKLQAKKSVAASAAFAVATHTYITAIQLTAP